MNYGSHRDGYHLLNVRTDAHAGKLDPLEEERTNLDLDAIRDYLRLEDRLRANHPGVKIPSIARSVLHSIWEAPRIGFHRDEIKEWKDFDLKNKLLLIPWSVEAYDLMKANNSISGLQLEHVTPIVEVWRELAELHRQAGEESWYFKANNLLVNGYRLAVLTVEQAKAIDAAELRTTGYIGDPFERYSQAIDVMNVRASEGMPPVPLDVSRFVHPGLI